MSRFTRLLVPALAALASVTAACGGENPFDAARSAETAVPQTTVGTGVENNVFLPEGQNVSDCVGTVERPNCGSKSKGGLHMNLVFAVLILGLGVIGWRISVSIRRRDAIVNAVPSDGSGWA